MWRNPDVQRSEWDERIIVKKGLVFDLLAPTPPVKLTNRQPFSPETLKLPLFIKRYDSFHYKLVQPFKSIVSIESTTAAIDYVKISGVIVRFDFIGKVCMYELIDLRNLISLMVKFFNLSSRNMV